LCPSKPERFVCMVNMLHEPVNYRRICEQHDLEFWPFRFYARFQNAKLLNKLGVLILREQHGNSEKTKSESQKFTARVVFTARRFPQLAPCDTSRY